MYLAGAASWAVRNLLAGPPTPALVRAAFGTCIYLEVAGRLLALETADGLGLPCSVRLGVTSTELARVATPRGLRTPRHACTPREASAGLVYVVDSGRAVVGGGRVVLGGLTVQVARWFVPRRPLGALPREKPRAQRRGGAPGVPGAYRGGRFPEPEPRVQRRGAAASEWDAWVGQLLGLGPGLTPAGDDLLAGLLVGLAGRPALRDPLAEAVLDRASARTTWLSAELLRSAADGLAIPAVVAAADALAGDGNDAEAHAAMTTLLGVGGTSGAALARGLLWAAELTRTDDEARMAPREPAHQPAIAGAA